jgi:hypothetical protein
MFLSPDTGARTRGDVLIEDGDRRVWALVHACGP